MRHIFGDDPPPAVARARVAAWTAHADSPTQIAQVLTGFSWTAPRSAKPRR